MSLWKDLAGVGVELLKAQCEGATRKARSVGSLVAACLVATILGLWGTALLLAAVFLGAAPHVGAAWAAVICSGAAFLLAAIILLVAMATRK